MPCIVKPPTIMSKASACLTIWAKTAACGPMMSSGYAGKIHIGVMFAIVKEAVDHLRTCQLRYRDWLIRSHMTRYTPIELTKARPTSTQKQTTEASFSQWPACLGPYCEILIRTVPNDTTAAGIKRRSVGCSIEALNVSGWQ